MVAREAEEERREDVELQRLLTLERVLWEEGRPEVESRVEYLVKRYLLRSSSVCTVPVRSTVTWNVLNRRCDICQQLQPSAQELLAHRSSCSSQGNINHTYTCLICYNNFARKHTLCRHILRSHVDTSESTPSSTINSSINPNPKHTLEKHHYDHLHLHTQSRSTATHRTNTRTNSHNCTICPKTFTDKQNLRRHSRTHTGEKPYECNVCHKRFIQSSDLRKHKRIHTGEKPYECDVCHKRFTQSVNLRTHKRIHTGEKSYECDVCHTRFTQLVNLRTHKRIHTGEKPFECDVCHKRFTHTTSLRRHKRIHTTE